MGVPRKVLWVSRCPTFVWWDSRSRLKDQAGQLGTLPLHRRRKSPSAALLRHQMFMKLLPSPSLPLSTALKTSKKQLPACFLEEVERGFLTASRGEGTSTSFCSVTPGQPSPSCSSS